MYSRDMSERDVVERKMGTMLGEWPERLALMESRAPAIPDARRGVYNDLLAKMRANYGEAVRALGDYGSAAAAAEPQARQRLERAWSDLVNTYEKALTQFEGVKN
jgi:hypothetical protein